MIHAEFQRFLYTLDDESTQRGVRKIANVIFRNLDDLIPLTTYQGQRVRQIVLLAQATWDTEREEIQDLPVGANEQSSNINILKNVTVGPFRGFSRQEYFDIDSRLVLVYGPNGTGKTSFCEALEYGLLGSVTEAECRRFRNPLEYLTNAHVDQLVLPDILAEDNYGNEIHVEANESIYRFCFVEKNRIDSFSHIAAQTPARQTELISTLFGLDLFNDFVRNFTAEIDNRYIDTVGKKATLLEQKRQGLAGAHHQIAVNSEELQNLDAEEQTLANQYRKDISFSEMVYELNGDDKNQGVIQRLESELRQPISTKSNLTIVELEVLKTSITNSTENLAAKQQELSAASQQVSYKQLYEAVSQVQQTSPKICPACKTDLSRVEINPYTFAERELEKLQHLAVLQSDIRQLEKNAHEALFNLCQTFNTCLRYYPQNNPLHAYKATDNQPETSWWNLLHQEMKDKSTPWQHLTSQVKRLEEADININQATQVRTKKQVNLDRFREFSRQITVLQTRRQSAVRAIANAQQLVSNFDSENAKLINDVEAEKIVVLRNREIASSYSGFVERLNAYNNNLPGQMVADLGEIVVTLYNAFNRNDSPNELLSNIKLPLEANQRLEITFQDNPDKSYDALQLLSEGHIRCIGLAVLLAKNLKENSPLLIFDDPVNAIDDDHRESIRRTIFEDQYFSDKQIILTCHGEEFFKDIHNLLPAQTAINTKSFAFLPRLDDSHIRVDFNCASRNYIVAAREHLDNSEIREALAKSRQALESLSKDKIWKYVHKYGDGRLSLKLNSPADPIELRNLTEQLKSKIGKREFGDPNKSIVFNLLDALIGLSGDSREWRYLNKGTHDDSDRPEFDRQTVQIIVSILEQLDAALS